MKILHYFLLILLFISTCSDGGDQDSISQSAGNLVLSSDHGGYPAAWGQSECAACHQPDNIHRKTTNLSQLADQKGFPACMGCHGDNGTGETRPCLICHNQTDLGDVPYLQGSHQHVFNSNDSKMGDRDCAVCHHASDMNGQFDLNIDLTRFNDAASQASPYNEEQDFCFRCHNSDHQQAAFPINETDSENAKVAIESYFTSIDAHGLKDGTGTKSMAGLRAGYAYKTLVKCSDCHQLHSTDNTKLVVDHSSRGVSLLDSSLRNPGYAIENTGGNFGTLCVMCHQMKTIKDDGELDAGNGLSGIHVTTGDCTLCHSHGETYQAGF